METLAMADERSQCVCHGKDSRASRGQAWNPNQFWMQNLSSPLKRWSITFQSNSQKSPPHLNCRSEIVKDVPVISNWLNLATNQSSIEAEQRLDRGNHKKQHGPGRSPDQLWKKFFSDPSQWLDHRFDKTNVRYPDFKHKKSQEGLWLDKKSTPYWVEAQLAALAPGTVQRSVFSWNKMIAQYVKEGQDKEALYLFQQMQKEGMIPDRFTFIRVIKACTNLVSLEKGRRIHLQAVESDYESDLFVGNCLIDMYGKCGSIGDALAVFKNMPIRDVVSWNAMIMGYVKCGQAETAFKLFWQMQREQAEPDNITFTSILNACGRMTSLAVGRHVHALVNQSVSTTGIAVGNSLIDMYCKCNSIEDAFNVFNCMEERTTVSWSTMLVGYAKCGQGEKALDLFRQMQFEQVKPDRMTFVAVLHACASVAALEIGLHVHKQVEQFGYESDVIVANSLIDMYSKCGRSVDARQVFDHMRTRNAVSWNAMINGYVKCGMAEMALKLFQQMEEERVDPDTVTFVGVLNACASVMALEEGRHVHGQVILRGFDSDVVLKNCLLNMYGKCGSIEDAHKLFNGMSIWDVVSWSAMLIGYVKCEQDEKAFALFQQMQRESVELDNVILGTVLNACSSLAAVEEGMQIHLQILRIGYKSDTFLENCLVDMYSKCGSIESALRIFNSMVKRDIVSWNAMITGCVKCGEEHKAIELFHQMLKEQLEPDNVTYISVLNACASMAMLEEGRNVHAHLVRSECKQDILVENSLVDMYSKCGSIEDACQVFDDMVMRDVVSWTTMLGGYAMHGLGNESLRLFEQLCRADPELDSATFVCLLSSCSHAGLVDEGQYYFESMNPLYGIPATGDHYMCMLDLLGRAGLR
ncbi:hypothetical protein O6H91_06G045400 [Diphasiastrum complanatum]|nr:hypothetical protein O6H91_06G045400 [Diphasiastrum complanatum]